MLSRTKVIILLIALSIATILLIVGIHYSNVYDRFMHNIHTWVLQVPLVEDRWKHILEQEDDLDKQSLLRHFFKIFSLKDIAFKEEDYVYIAIFRDDKKQGSLHLEYFPYDVLSHFNTKSKNNIKARTEYIQYFQNIVIDKLSFLTDEVPYYWFGKLPYQYFIQRITFENQFYYVVRFEKISILTVHIVALYLGALLLFSLYFLFLRFIFRSYDNSFKCVVDSLSALVSTGKVIELDLPSNKLLCDYLRRFNVLLNDFSKSSKELTDGGKQSLEMISSLHGSNQIIPFIQKRLFNKAYFSFIDIKCVIFPQKSIPSQSTFMLCRQVLNRVFMFFGSFKLVNNIEAALEKVLLQEMFLNLAQQDTNTLTFYRRIQKRLMSCVTYSPGGLLLLWDKVKRCIFISSLGDYNIFIWDPFQGVSHLVLSHHNIEDGFELDNPITYELQRDQKLIIVSDIWLHKIEMSPTTFLNKILLEVYGIIYDDVDLEQVSNRVFNKDILKNIIKKMYTVGVPKDPSLKSLLEVISILEWNKLT